MATRMEMMMRIFGMEENFGAEENMLQSHHSSLTRAGPSRILYHQLYNIWRLIQTIFESKNVKSGSLPCDVEKAR